MTKACLKTNVTNETWSAELKTLDANNRATRKAVQAMAVFCINSYTHPEASTSEVNTALRRMTSLYNKCKSIKAHGDLLTFFKAHLNVKGENVGKANFKIVKSGNGKARLKREVTTFWSDYETEKKAPVAHSINDMVDSFLKSLDNKVAKGLVTDPQHLEDFKRYINAYEGLNEEVTLKAVA